MKNYAYEITGYKLLSNPDTGLVLRFKTNLDARSVRVSIISSYYKTDDDSFKNITNMYTNENVTTIYFDSWDSRENFMRRHIKYEGPNVYYMTVASNPYVEFNQSDYSFTCTIDDIDEEVRKMLMNTPNALKPETADLKSAMNSIYGVKNMKKLIDTDSIHISTEGYEPTLRWTGEGYTKLFEDASFRMYDTPFLTFEYKEDKNLDKKIRHIQINEKKKVVTIVWKDGDVTMAKCSPNDTWDPEKGLLVCVAKHGFKSSTQFNKWRKRVVPEEEEETKSLLDNIVEGIKNNYQPKHSATE